MERRGWRALLLASLMAMAATRTASAQEGPARTITVRMDDKAGVQGALLKIAEARATDVFAMSGVRLEWIDGGDAIRQKITTDFIILIMAEAPAKLKAAMENLGSDVMGQGAPSAGRAYIYYDRIVAFRPVPPRDIPTTLGDVMAHELGHLILPPGHSSTGIMRPTIATTSRRIETFTKSEASEIQSRLSARSTR